MPRFDELAALVPTVEHGSFSAAGERLAIAKSAVSRRVTDLEAHMGVRLLNRTTRRFDLTEPGRVLHERAVRLLAHRFQRKAPWADYPTGACHEMSAQVD